MSEVAFDEVAAAAQFLEQQQAAEPVAEEVPAELALEEAPQETETSAPYDPNDPASIDQYIQQQSLGLAQQHLQTLAEQYQQQQAEQEAQQAAIAQWLGEPDSPGYEARLQEILVEQRLQERLQPLRDSLAPFQEHIEAQAAAEQAAIAEQQAEAELTSAVDQATAIYDELHEHEGVGEFDYTAAWNLAENIVSMRLGEMVSRGIAPEVALQALKEANFAEAAVRAGARVAAEQAANAPAAEKPVAPPNDELAVARRFMDKPRSPGEAIRQHAGLRAQAEASPALAREVDRWGQRLDLKYAEPAQTEAEVAQRFLERRHAAA